MVRLLLLCALLLAGCASPRQPNSSEAIADQKQQARARRQADNDKRNEELRRATRQLYVQDHPDLKPDVRKAILKERIKIGMTDWQVIAAYSLWEYTSDASVARYRDLGAAPLWTIADRRQTSAGQTRQEQWTLEREKATQTLYFENGLLTKRQD
jgi:hypothetical protein